MIPTLFYSHKDNLELSQIGFLSFSTVTNYNHTFVFCNQAAVIHFLLFICHPHSTSSSFVNWMQEVKIRPTPAVSYSFSLSLQLLLSLKQADECNSLSKGCREANFCSQLNVHEGKLPSPVRIRSVIPAFCAAVSLLFTTTTVIVRVISCFIL